jgi:hypothetical protein
MTTTDGGEMGELVRSVCWGRHAARSLESWSPTLRTMGSVNFATVFP